ncbi:MAG TPA: homoserine kinase [Candidatus Eisenbacteria bacterium]|nr:homoserine kinase [Candidatus Eisenbacteria bacterium]
MPVHRAIAFAPATVANVGPGFDVFGFALEKPGDTVEAWRIEKKGVRLVEVTGDDGKLTRETDKNVASAVAGRMLRGAAAKFGVAVSLHKGLPLGSGLGSSSASAVAAALAVNAILDRPYAQDELLEFARYGEKIACGAAHVDNVAPALYGGFTVIVRQEPPEVVRLQCPKSWRAVVAHPHFELSTRKARAVLPRTVPLSRVTANVAGAAAAVAAVMGGDLASLGRAITREAIVTRARAGLIPGFKEVGEAAMAAGAAGFSISGAGPSIFALTDGDRRATLVGAKMVAAWRRLGIAADLYVSRVGAPGARLLGDKRS